MNKILIKFASKEFFAQLNDSETANEIYDALPLEAEVNTWGEEIYFEIPVQYPIEKAYAREVVELGDCAFWPRGSCFCIFFGPTPVSKKGEIRPASTVNLVGKIEGDLEALRKIKEKTPVIIDKA
jgi:hypothetical protein